MKRLISLFSVFHSRQISGLILSWNPPVQQLLSQHNVETFRQGHRQGPIVDGEQKMETESNLPENKNKETNNTSNPYLDVF